MNSKLFGLLVALVVIAVGIAALSLFKEEADPGSTPGITTPSVPENGMTAPPVAPPEVGTGATSGEREPAETVREAPRIVDPVDIPRKVTVRGTVRASDSKKPLAQADVELVDDEGEELESAVSGEDGSYTIVLEGALPPTFDAKAVKEGYSSQHVIGDLGPGAADEMTVDFLLGATFSIEGRVVGAIDGKPVGGADVSVQSRAIAFDSMWESAETDDSGYYKISNVETLPREDIDVTCEPSGYVPAVVKAVSLEPGQSVLRVDFRVYESLVFKGKVVGAAANQPVEEATIAALSRDEDFEQMPEEEVTDEDGTFEFEVSAMPFEGLFLLVHESGHSAVVIDSIPMPDMKGVVDLGTIVLPPLVTLRGYVVNALTGAPVKGGDVTVYASVHPDRDESSYTDDESIDDDGRFEVQLENTPPSVAEIFVEGNECAPLRQKLEIPPNTQQFEVRFAVQPTLILSGYVKRKVDGTPVVSARVRVNVAGSIGSRFETRSHSDGTYKVEIAPDVNLADTEISVKPVNAKEFRLGPVPAPPGGTFRVEKDLVVDVEAIKR